MFLFFIFLILLLFTLIFQCIFKKNSKNTKSPSIPNASVAAAKNERKKTKSDEIRNNDLVSKDKVSSGDKQQQQQQQNVQEKKVGSKEESVLKVLPSPILNPVAVEIKESESENIIPIMCIRPPNDAAEHVKKFYESTEAQLIMEAELVAYEEMDKVVRLELFARVVHYIDSKLQGQGVDFSELPPIVPESAKQWALARGMPPILRARTEMLIEYEKFMCPVPDDLNHLPPDGSLNTVYKHAMREDLNFNERMELLDELFARTCRNVAQKWNLILTQKTPYPTLGRAFRRNPQIFKEFKAQPRELSIT